MTGPKIILYMMAPSIRMVSSWLYRYDLRENSLTGTRFGGTPKLYDK